MSDKVTKYGFIRCEFDDDTCEKCHREVKEIYFRPTVSSTKGEYWCMPCIKKEEVDNEEYNKKMEAMIEAEMHNENDSL